MSDFQAQWQDPNPWIEAYTSGSTGEPKMVRLLKEDMRRSARATNKFFGINSNSLLALPLADSYIAGKMMKVRAWESGAQLIEESPGRKPFAEPVGREVDLVAIVPQQTEGLIASPNQWRNVIVGGAPMPEDLKEKAMAHMKLTGARWWMTYGMTETCSHVALRPMESGFYTALPGVKFALDSRGCLRIEDEGASWSPIVTNDIVELVDNHRFRWLGRIDNVVISGGIKLHPELIEPKIAPLAEGREFFLTGRTSALWGEELVMVVEGELSEEQRSELWQEMRKKLALHEVPKEIIAKKSLERTHSGKVIRRI